MARTIGQGNQILLFGYKTDLDWDILNNQFVNLFSDGIISANVTVKDASTITVNYVSAFIIPDNSPNEIVKMETTSAFDMTITDPTTQFYLVLTYSFVQNEFNSVQFNLTNTLYPTSYAVPVCRLLFDGSNNLTGIDYSVQKKSYGTHSHDLQYYPRNELYTKTESDNRFVLKTGDTMTGNLIINTGTNNNWFTLTSGDGTNYFYSLIALRDNNVERWTIFKNNDAISDLVIARYNDDGSWKNAAMIFHRTIDLIDMNASSLKISGTYKTAGAFYTGTVDPTATNRLNYDGYFYATRVYNAIYNDIADFLDTDLEEIEYGKVYKRTEDYKIRKTETYCDTGILGIASDTYGFGLGEGKGKIPIAIAGFVLAYVDNEYKPGTPLTATQDGWLTEWKSDICCESCIVAYYDRPEAKLKWNDILVKGRHWVKVK